MKRIYWKGICNKNRIEGISSIEEVISEYGFLLDIKLFSDLSISMIIEIEERNIYSLYQNLSEMIDMSDFVDFASSSTRERVILFNVTFVKGSGDLRVEVPASPG